jgi:hypothetical protein
VNTECRWCGKPADEGQTICGLSVVRLGPSNSATPSGINIIYHVSCWLEMMPKKPLVSINEKI